MILIQSQTYLGIFIPITQMRKLRPEVTCSKSHQQLVSELGFKLKRFKFLKSKPVAFHLALLPLSGQTFNRLQAGTGDSAARRGPKSEPEPGAGLANLKDGQPPFLQDMLKHAQARGTAIVTGATTACQSVTGRWLPVPAGKDRQPGNSLGISFQSHSGKHR